MKQSAAHSAINPCGTQQHCGRCFNNIVDPNGFVLMTTPKVCTQSIWAAYRITGCMGGFRSKQFVLDHCKDMFIVGFIRNPFDRLVSCWYDKCIIQNHRTNTLYGLRHGMPFETFAKTITEVPHHQADKHWRPQSFDMYTPMGRVLPHVFVRFENIASDWNAACLQIEKHSGARLPALQHKHASNKGPWREYYTPDLIERVGDYFHDDLVNFGYSFGEQAHLPIGAAAV